MAFNSTHTAGMGTPGLSPNRVWKARLKPNSDNVDRSEDQARVTQNPVADIQLWQDGGVGIGEQEIHCTHQYT
jgi:hypothetical protein